MTLKCPKLTKSNQIQSSHKPQQNAAPVIPQAHAADVVEGAGETEEGTLIVTTMMMTTTAMAAITITVMEVTTITAVGAATIPTMGAGMILIVVLAGMVAVEATMTATVAVAVEVTTTE